MKLTLIALALFLFTASVFAQTAQISTTEAIEKPKRAWKLEMELEATNLLETPNKVELVKSAVVKYKTNYYTRAGKYLFRLGGQAVIPVNRDPDKFFGVVELEANRNFGKTNLSTDAQFWFANRTRIGVASVTLSRNVNLAEDLRILPFTKISYFFPLEQGLRNDSKALVWSTGFTTKAEFGEENQFNHKKEFELSSQIIADGGAIHPGRRLALNIESGFLLPFRGLRLGPKVGYTNFLSGHYKKKHVLNYGLWVKLR